MITPIYAAILALIFVYLSFRTINARKVHKMSLGHSNDAVFRATRVHGNFAEYTPIGILLIYFVEVGQGPITLVHTLGATFVIARLLHAFGVAQDPEPMIFRMVGMVLTLCTIIVASVFLLYRAFVFNL